MTAFQKIYTKITNITKATCSLRATGIGNEELAWVAGRLAQVVKIQGDEVVLQVFAGTEGIPTNAEVVFMGQAPSLKVGDQLAGRFFNAYGDPIDGGNVPEGKEVEIGGPHKRLLLSTFLHGQLFFVLYFHFQLSRQFPRLKPHHTLLRTSVA